MQKTGKIYIPEMSQNIEKYDELCYYMGCEWYIIIPGGSYGKTDTSQTRRQSF